MKPPIKQAHIFGGNTKSKAMLEQMFREIFPGIKFVTVPRPNPKKKKK